MKSIIATIFTLILLPKLEAQTIYPTQVVLSNGAAFTITTNTSQVTDMGMGMAMNLNFSTIHNANVNGASNNNYSMTATLKTYKFKGDGMGASDIAYNSDSSKEVLAGMEGISALINKPVSFLVDKQTGTAKPTDEATPAETNNDNPMQSMMGAMSDGSSPATLNNISFIIPANASIGYVWHDSTTANGFTNKTTYTLVETKADISTVKMSGTVVGSSTMEMQGTALDMKMTTKNNGTIIVNRKTNVCISRTLEADVDAVVDMMGQTMNITSKASSTTTIN